MVEQQLKMFKLFDQKGFSSLSEIFGENNVVEFKNTDIIGIKYDYEKNKLKHVMKKVPFTLTQQFIMTSLHFVEIIENIGSIGCRPNFTINMDLPEEELTQINEYIFKISKPDSDKEICKKHIFNEINRLEEEYGVEFESVSFTFENHRIVFRNNGIVFVAEDLFDTAGEMLCY
ncbi:hypothetical protein [Pseudalkalibacillus salsuginis]|uniref:hypothetical protein n=1 Tax=Pseudalkalibacillus salsuginis TaxID=2910972 RepID=UPI001F3009D9|nr:hypothetical protein [Pseudalkalibacillus salsuginis]MCF6409016.1 hypothetical protein [Pseudalkalibacillus salsuginis]